MNRRRFAHSSNPAFACSPAVLLLPFGRETYLPAIVERLGAEELPLGPTTDRIAYRLGGAEPPVTLIYSGMGAPAAANALEMAAANGARRVVLFGACGGVGPEVGVGDLIVATGGVRGEGTSAYYAPAEFPAACDPTLTGELRRAAAARTGAGVHRGVVYTTDASYRQGAEVYSRFDGLIVAVDCECAAAAVVAARLGLELGALLFVTDNVGLAAAEDRSYRGLEDGRVRAAFEAGLDSALEVLRAPAAAGAAPDGV